jgi:hypothetical protein
MPPPQNRPDQGAESRLHQKLDQMTLTIVHAIAGAGGTPSGVPDPQALVRIETSLGLLAAEVHGDTDAVTSLRRLVKGFAALLAEAAANNDMGAIQTIIDKMDKNTEHWTQVALANTPAAPAAV